MKKFFGKVCSYLVTGWVLLCLTVGYFHVITWIIDHVIELIDKRRKKKEKDELKDLFGVD